MDEEPVREEAGPGTPLPRSAEAELLELRAQYAALAEDAARLRRRLRREEERVRAIQSMGAALGSSLDLDSVLQVVVGAITRMLEADRSTLFLVDEQRQHLVARVAQGEDGRELRLRIGEGIAGWVARTGRPVNLKDAYQDRRFNPIVDQLTGYRTRSILCVPVKDPRRLRTIGVLQVLNKRRGYFTVADEELLRGLTAQAAITVVNSQLFVTLMRKNMELLEARDQLQGKVRELDQLYELSQALQRSGSEDELLNAVLDKAAELLPSAAVGLLLLDDEGGCLRYSSRPPDQPIRRGTLRLGLGEGVVSLVAQDGHPRSLDSMGEDPAHRVRLEAALGTPLRNLLTVPLRINEQALGALQLMNRRGGTARRYGPEDQTLAALIADQTSKALDLLRQIEDRAQRERLATVGQLLSSILHDIKGPISVISGYVQLMVRKDAREDRERYEAVVHRQFEHLASMTQEVLSFARGESSLLLRRSHLSQFMAELDELFRAQVAGRKLELQVQDEHGGSAVFDQVKMTRALSNLVRNAIEALGDEPGSLTVAAARADDGALLFTVSDSGPGIPDEIRGRLFDTFVSRGKKDGSGLGLAIVRKIVEEHGGEVSFDSSPGLGTRFEIRIPQAEESP